MSIGLEKIPIQAYQLVAFLMPLSIDTVIAKGVQLDLPTEPLLVLLFGFLVIYKSEQLRLLIPRLSIFYPLMGWVAWNLIAALVSTQPIVSLKYVAVAVLHIVVFVAMVLLYRPQVKAFLRAFAWGLALVVLYTMARYGWYFDFRDDQAILAPMPFFPENTLYAAVLASALFMSGMEWFTEKTFKNGVLLAVLIAGLCLSSCRTAMVTFGVVGTGAYILLRYNLVAGLVHFRKTTVIVSLVATLFALGALLCFHTSTDVSLAERLNRYDCAYRMAQEKPLLGFGPGTYQFAYISFQKAEFLTRISASAPVTERNMNTYGRGGGAHSEYFQSLSELGYLGLGIWLWLIFGVVHTVLAKGAKWIQVKSQPHENYFQLWLILGFIVFLLHGFLNNFLHDSCMAFLFWTAATYITYDNNTPTLLDRE